ncbi:hypothetical protein [Petrimonas mucosa]|uniref:hypothetical protein n=1 Tax=Petrimonas mucosa TaxID=1642646 RepID=UPI00176CE46E|nr:hypothetical protein [Petrimonas mucosa]HHT28990.1 hypothetical protein [Petrimonas mucosa]
MTNEQLATEYGEMAARALNFLYDKLVSLPDITDAVKQNVKTERETIFATLVPIIKKFNTMGDDDKQTFKRTMSLAMLEKVDDIADRSAAFQSALETLSATPDQNFVMDVLSLYVVTSFLEEGAFDDEDAPPLLAHVGLE